MSALACLAAPAWGDAPAPEFRFRAPILAAPGHSHYRVSMPAAVYAGLERKGLADLRVLNASGETVPHAFVPRGPSGPAPVQSGVARLFPLHGESAAGLEGVKLDVVRGAGGTVIRLAADAKGKKAGRKLLGYLVDAGESELPMEALLLDWRTGSGFNGAARVEASDDLSRWNSWTAEAPVLALEHAGERLERKRLELGGRKARYLRLSFTRVPEDFVLTSVQVERRLERGEPAREWRRVARAADTGKPGEYRFDAGGRHPVDRLRLQLPQANTVARVQILTRDDERAPWRTAASALVFRLERNGVTASNPDIAVAPGMEAQWLLQVDQRGGGIGAGEPILEAGWVPHEIVFAARGAAPFALAYGSRRAKAEALPLATVVPGYEVGKDIAAERATVNETSGTARPPVSWSDPVGLMRDLLESGDGKKWLLWLVLSVGVLAVAWMALRLLRDLGGKPPPSS
jgi:hypothetical protein